MFIDIKDARKHYGEGETLVNALDGVSLSLGEGRIYVILGPSGSGKSTLLNMIGGLDSLDSGEITISGRNISRSDKKKMTTEGKMLDLYSSFTICFQTLLCRRIFRLSLILQSSQWI